MNLQDVEDGMLNARQNTPIPATICQCIQYLYQKELGRNHWPDAFILEQMYLMAKKMNHRLVEYKEHAGKSTPINLKGWMQDIDSFKKKAIILYADD